VGDPTADTIIQALRNAPHGLDRTAISSLFKRHKSSEDISRALTVLREHGLAKVSQVSQDATGRPPEIWFEVGGVAKEAN
jgi:DNA-binding transcriptional ArsR family regulator